MKKVQQLLRQLQTSDHRFRAISALISAASPEKWIGMLSEEPHLGQRISTSKVAHSAITNIARSIIIKGNKKVGVNRWNPVEKATYFLKKIKSGKK